MGPAQLERKTRAPTASTLYEAMPLYELERSMEDIAFEFPRAKKEVWDKRRVVTVVAVGGRSSRARE